MDANVYRSDIREKIETIRLGREKGDAAILADCDEIEAYGIKQRDKALVGFSHYSRGCVYYAANDVPAFFREMLESRGPLLEAQEYDTYVQANVMLGLMSIVRGNTPDGLDYYTAALAICKEHVLPDVEWIVQMRIGGMFQTLDEYDRALEHYTRALYYIEGHPKMERRPMWLAFAYAGICKAYVEKEEAMQALVYITKIEQECLDSLNENSTMIYECLAARVYAALKDQKKYVDFIRRVAAHSTETLPLMDVFDDIYQYLKLLLEKNERTYFTALLNDMIVMCNSAKVKYLQKKLLTLKLRSDRKYDEEETLKDDAVLYYELSAQMAQEDRMMMKRDIKRRYEVQDLVEEKREMEKENRSLLAKSETDDLTGIYNRYKLNIYGDIAFERAIKNDVPVAVEILDVDSFTEYNDHYGRQEGDRCLRFVAGEIAAKTKEYGAIFAARYGGAEFVLIYEGYTDKEVFGIARALRDAIATKKVEHRYTKGKNKYVTISQGIYWGVPEEGMRLWDFLHAADNVRYRLKQKTTGSIMVGTAGNEKSSTYATEDGIETIDPIIRYHGNIEDEQ